MDDGGEVFIKSRIKRIKHILESMLDKSYYLSDNYLSSVRNRVDIDNIYDDFININDIEDNYDDYYNSPEFNSYFVEIMRYRIDRLFSRLNEQRHGEGIKLYRGLVLSDINDLRNPLGVYWTWDISKAKQYMSEGADNLYIIEGLIPESEINMDMTIILQAYYDPEDEEFAENEVRILKGTSIRILNILDHNLKPIEIPNNILKEPYVA